jgi:hypothetical protein
MFTAERHPTSPEIHQIPAEPIIGPFTDLSQIQAMIGSRFAAEELAFHYPQPQVFEEILGSPPQETTNHIDGDPELLDHFTYPSVPLIAVHSPPAEFDLASIYPQIQFDPQSDFLNFESNAQNVGHEPIEIDPALTLDEYDLSSNAPSPSAIHAREPTPSASSRFEFVQPELEAMVEEHAPSVSHESIQIDPALTLDEYDLTSNVPSPSGTYPDESSLPIHSQLDFVLPEPETLADEPLEVVNHWKNAPSNDERVTKEKELQETQKTMLSAPNEEEIQSRGLSPSLSALRPEESVNYAEVSGNSQLFTKLMNFD